MIDHKKNKYYPKEECGITAVYKIPEASIMAYLGIYALQHRGQESAGIVSLNEGKMYRHAGMGKVTDIFNKNILSQLKGDTAIAHNRYSTTGASFITNAQPILMESRLGNIGVAHNGNLTNAHVLRKNLEAQGSIFQTTADTEVIVHLMARSPHSSMKEAFIYALKNITGAYSLILLTNDGLYAARDPHGFRPLVLGKKDSGYILASETCALDILDAEYVRDIEPGECIVLNNEGIQSFFPLEKIKESLCVFELIYFSRPDSNIFNQSIYETRLRMGATLAKESPIDADVVISVPDSSNVAAYGYSKESGIPYHAGLIRSHYIGRTFIEPDQKIRDFGAKLKYNTISSVIKDKRVVVVDDSIVRGTTSKKIVNMLRKAGAKEIHLRIASSPTKFACYYGIDIPTSKELIASQYKVDEIAKLLGVDSLSYLSLKGMTEAADKNKSFCTACFSGEYPTPINIQDIIQERLFENIESNQNNVL